MKKIQCLALSLLVVSSCSTPTPGPDKTVGGAVLGAGWGAGAGAVVGHQLSYAGEGAAVGAGFGLVSGALQGAGYDIAEEDQLEVERELARLRVQNASNAREIQSLQSKFDQAISASSNGGVYQVFFDSDATNLRSGAVANLEVIADSLKRSPHAYVVHVVGHSDDSGNADHNARVAEARARTVQGYLAARGISMDQIQLKSFGSTRPMASNATETGRQLNRRVDIFIARRSAEAAPVSE